MSDTGKLIDRLRKASRIERKEWGALNEDAAPLYDEAADTITDLEARLRIAEKARESCETRNDFLISELDKFIEKVKA